MKKIKVRNWCVCAVLAAMSAVLMFFFEFPLPFLPPYLKFDFGELPALIGAFALGPFWGAAICFIKNLICLLKTATGGAGEFANFLVGATFVVTAGAIYKHKKTKKGALAASVCATVVMSVVSVGVNYFITYPIYAKVLMPYDVIVGMYSSICPWADTLLKGLLVFNTPFTLAKGIAVSAITMGIYKKISPLIKGK